MQHPPPAICQNWGRGSLGGGRLEGVCGEEGFGCRAAGGSQGWGGLRATHYHHMHTSRGDVWGFAVMEVCM